MDVTPDEATTSTRQVGREKQAGPRILVVTALGQIASASIALGDLTVLVGPQATGKSLILQVLKLAVDHAAILSTFKQNGVEFGRRWEDFLDAYFGEGMSSLWGDATAAAFGPTKVGPNLLRSRKPTLQHRMVYVPAQRTLTLPGGFPKRFREFGIETPFVVREYSALLHDALIERRFEKESQLFPNLGRLRAPVRRQVDEAVFHGARLVTDRETRQAELRLRVAGTALPMMAWTAGQREFVPLLLGLYPLLPAGRITRDPDTEWIVIEELEMGLHPKAIIAVMNLVIGLVARGYRVVLSTHHPVVLDVLWAIGVLRSSDHSNRARLLARALGTGSDTAAVNAAATVLGKDVRVHALSYQSDGLVTSAEISSLDPSAATELERGWGGLTTFSAGLAAAVAEASA